MCDNDKFSVWRDLKNDTKFNNPSTNFSKLQNPYRNKNEYCIIHFKRHSTYLFTVFNRIVKTHYTMMIIISDVAVIHFAVLISLKLYGHLLYRECFKSRHCYTPLLHHNSFHTFITTDVIEIGINEFFNTHSSSFNIIKIAFANSRLPS